MKKFYILLLLLALSPVPSALAQEYGWTDISANMPGTPDLSDVFFVSDNEGWITSSSQAEIYHTTDGGETFEVQTNPFSTSIQAIYMINQSEGYCGGLSGFVYKTTNGGVNWDFHGTLAGTLIDIDFASPTQGYACGNSGGVYSISGSVTNLNSGQPTNFSGISAPSANNVWLCGGNDIMYYNGTIFEFQAGPAGTYNAICFINNDKGWVVGNAGVIGHTEDGGENWHQQINPVSYSLFEVFFLNNEVGWAVGSTGTILQTSDRGESWQVEGAGLTTNLLRGIHFTSPTNGYVVGNGKTLLKYGELTGTDEVTETLQFEIYPNPAGKKFGIRCLEFGVNGGTLEIYDLNSRKLLEKHIQAGNETVEVDASSLESSVYFCRLLSEKFSVTKKLIIQK